MYNPNFTINGPHYKPYLVTYTESFGDGPVDVKVDYDRLVDALAMIRHLTEQKKNQN